MFHKHQIQKFQVYYKKLLAIIASKKTLLGFILIIFIIFFPLHQLISLWIDNKIRTTILNSINSNNKVHSEEDSLKQYRVDTAMGNENMEAYKERLLKMTSCYNRALNPAIEQHGAFWVLSNYIRAEKQYECYESVTYTTQGDYTFLDNLVPLIKRWRGPVSLALHAPGTDFQPTIDSIAYLRNCESSLIKKYVTFHLLFDMEHAPKKSTNKSFDLPLWELYKDTYNCSKGAPFANVSYKDLYKLEANLSYPINVARNVARERAQTHFVLASDIELYPSPNLIHQFLSMLIRKPYIFETEDPVIFVLPVFEVLANESVPENKRQLQEMIKSNRSFSFHKSICNRCHAIPQLDEWLSLEPSDELDIFTTTKRQGKHVRWEAVYIGTNEDPVFDERLDWERHGNKMSQAYALCLLNYDYMVLDNAFLAHKPGIKMKMVNAEVIPKTAKYISDYLGVQLNTIYGKRKGCKA